MDQTTVFWDLAAQQARIQGLSEERLAKLKSAQILRSLAGKSEFIRAATEVARNITVLREFVGEHRREYLQSGKLDEKEKDRIEEQVGLYVRSCTQNIQKLEASIANAQGLSPLSVAHRHGVALILSERLQTISSVFDVCRSQRYQQLAVQRQRQQKRQNEIERLKARGRLLTANGSPSSGVLSPDVRENMQQQQLIAAENRALQEELQSLSQQVAQTESSMHEISMLNQMFTTQVLHQSELTRQLYNQAVEATENLNKGNVQLEKAIRLNSSTRKLLFCFFFIASLLLLLFDWWSS